MNNSRNQGRRKRHRRIRGRVKGTAEKPRLNVFFSLRYVYAQAIDDENNKVIVQANSKELVKKISSRGKVATGEAVGRLIAERCLKKNIKQVVFDRGGYKYHGKIKALAEAARKAGLEFWFMK